MTIMMCAWAGSAVRGQDFDAHRYTEPVAASVVKTAAVVYATAPALATPWQSEANTVNEQLAMDIFAPTGDFLQRRPAILFFHGGAFVSGSRNNEDMVAMCDTFARLGYVTATVSYRLGMAPGDDNSPARAVYRGLQDGRAAVRFMRANAATYGIDSSRIYAVGSSAGAFICLHSVYMNNPAEKPAAAGAYTITVGVPPFQTTINVPDLGGYDIGNHLDRDGTPDAIVGLWGALQSEALIDGGGHKPLLLVHGTADNIVPFEIGSPFGYSGFPPTSGSGTIAQALRVRELDHESYFVEGAPHEFYGVQNGNFDDDGVPGPNEQYGVVLARMKAFLRNVHRPAAEIDFEATGLQLSVSAVDMPRPRNAVAWRWEFGDGGLSYAKDTVYTYASAGTYTIRLTVLNEIASWDTVSETIAVGDNTGVSPCRAFSCGPGGRYDRGAPRLYDLRGRAVAVPLAGATHRVTVEAPSRSRAALVVRR